MYTDSLVYRPVARIRITPVTLHGGVRKSRAGGPPLWRIVLTCDIRRHLGHLPGRVSAIEGVCRSVFGTVQHTVRHKQAEPSFVKKLAINTASVHFAIDKIRVVLQAWALIIRILYVTLLMTSRAMGLLQDLLSYTHAKSGQTCTRTHIERFHVTSRVQNRAPFWCTCTALNYCEAGLPPHEAAVEHGAHRCQVGWKRRQTFLEVR